LAAPSEGWTFDALVASANELSVRLGGPVILGIDAVLGVPEAFLDQLITHPGYRHVRGFLDLLRTDLAGKQFYEPSLTADAWLLTRPFFAVPKGEGALTEFVDAAGGDRVLRRRVDRQTHGKSVFILSGIGGTVGSGSIALWQEMAPHFGGEHSRDFVVWPFECDLEHLSGRNRVVVCEIYPRASYGIALADELPVAARTIAKTKRDPRDEALVELRASGWLARHSVSITGTELASSNEDEFDALMSAVATLRLLLDGQGLSSVSDHTSVEGGILGLEALESRTSPQRSHVPSHTSDVSRKSITVPGLDCPIPGCNKRFQNGRMGWDAHVASLRLHPEWYPALTAGEERKARFRQEFRDWFEEAGSR
jgi:hypothetical protein